MSDHNPETTPLLHLPEEMRYDCIKCGRACIDFHDIPVEHSCVERLSKFDILAALPSDRRDPPFVPSPGDPTRLMMRRHNKQCVCLTPDRLCLLHKKFGPENKPQACIDFPFRFVDTPDGPFVGVTFACTAILQESGAPLEEKRAHLTDLYPRAFSRRKGELRPSLTADIAIDWDAYRLLEADLDAILQIPGQPIDRRLVAQAAYMDMLVRTFTLARRQEIPDAGPHASTPAERIALSKLTDLEILQHFSARMRKDQWAFLLLTALKAKPSPIIQRAFIGLMTTLRQAVSAPRTRTEVVALIVKTYAAHAIGMGAIRLEPLTATFPYTAFKKVDVDLTPGDYFDHALTRFFRHQLYRKDLLLLDNLWIAHRFMLMHFALIRWYAVGLTTLDGQANVSRLILQEAIRNTEKHYVLHSRFDRLFENFPTLGIALDRLLHNPRFPGAMAGPAM